MNSGDLRDAWTRLLHAMEGVEDVSVLIGQSDREQAARLRQIVQAIEAEAAVLAQKTDAMRRAEKAARKQDRE
jgi:outer membrane murein-binding lipoprotein Lpp